MATVAGAAGPTKRNPCLDVVAAGGRPFRVVYIPEGGQSDNRPERAGGGALVEFYDSSQDPDKFTADGQFAGSYYAETLMERQRGWELSLHGGIPEWDLDADTMIVVLDWLAAQGGVA